MEINRYLRKDAQNKEGESPIEFRLTWAGKKVRWSSNMRCTHKLWDAAKQRVKNGSTSSIWINDQLDKMEKIAVDTFREVATGNNPTEYEMKSALMIALGKQKPTKVEEPKPEVSTVSAYWHSFIARSVSRYSAGYISAHKAALKLWDDAFSGLAWHEVTQEVVELFVDVMIGEELSNSTIKMYLSRFAILVEEARGEGFSVTVNMRKVYIDGYESIPIFHTMPEVRQIMATEYSKANLKIVADAYVFAIASGVRFSDLVRISNAEVTLERDENDEMVGYISLLQKKTSQPLVVTMTDLATQIWMKYEGNPLAHYKRVRGEGAISSTSYHHLLRRVCQEAGIDTPTIKRWKVGNEWREKRGPKYEFVHSHVARHTYCMIGLELGVPIEVIQKGVGHTDITSTMRYARISEGKASKVINSKWKKF